MAYEIGQIIEGKSLGVFKVVEFEDRNGVPGARCVLLNPSDHSQTLPGATIWVRDDAATPVEIPPEE